ncbi:hypothetical protein HDV05_005896 [Chytridiales sp. JEL 0842]|nr:hypothetical protein HDV05_005896 [Chytridiales sp. JEL 0842]
MKSIQVIAAFTFLISSVFVQASHHHVQADLINPTPKSSPSSSALNIPPRAISKKPKKPKKTKVSKGITPPVDCSPCSIPIRNTLATCDGNQNTMTPSLALPFPRAKLFDCLCDALPPTLSALPYQCGFDAYEDCDVSTPSSSIDIDNVIDFAEDACRPATVGGRNLSCVDFMLKTNADMQRCSASNGTADEKCRCDLFLNDGVEEAFFGACRSWLDDDDDQIRKDVAGLNSFCLNLGKKSAGVKAGVLGGVGGVFGIAVVGLFLLL